MCPLSPSSFETGPFARHGDEPSQLGWKLANSSTQSPHPIWAAGAFRVPSLLLSFLIAEQML